jgi:hyperosmotically inducible protein
MGVNHLKLVIPVTFLCSVLLSAGPSASAQTPSDNTKANSADRAKNAVTADQQKNNAADRQLTQQIRQALTADKSLSSYAHNVKVITQGGQVILKGPVRSEAEKQSVEAKAIGVAGAGHVKNEISVPPARKSASTK